MENPTKLFEKYTHNVDRITQKEEWEAIADKLNGVGIYVQSIPKLRQSINNWTRRAIVSQFIN